MGYGVPRRASGATGGGMTDSAVCTKYVRVPKIGTVDVPKIGTPKKRGRFGITPLEILCHERLTFCARVVYGFLNAHSFGGKPATVGIRRIAKMLNASPSTIQIAIADLSNAGCISIGIDESTKRNVYNMLQVPIVDKLKPQISRCQKCNKPRVLRSTGWCKACETTVELDSRIDRRALAVARREISTAKRTA